MRTCLWGLSFFAFAAGLSMIHAGESVQRARSTDRVITSPRFDPDLERVELFDGMEAGQFETKVIAMGPQKGNLLIQNITAKPLTVEMPESFVAVHVLKQFQANPFQPNGSADQNQNQQQGGQGGQQPIGGGAQQGNNQPSQNPFGNGANGQGNGNNFFSIPPERTIKVSYVSACLEHGKADPTPRANYELVRTSEYTKDRVLQEVIAMVASGRLDAKAAQAAVWHRSDNMNWRQLAAKYSHTVLGRVPYFKASELELAQKIVVEASRRKDLERRPIVDDAVVAEIPTQSR